MALVASSARTCSMADICNELHPKVKQGVLCQGVNEKHLTTAIFFEAVRGYPSAFGRSMRFSYFLHSNLLKLCSRSNHKSTQRLLEEVSHYGTASMSDRSKLLRKISVLMGYSDVHDLLEHERARGESDEELRDTINELEMLSACSKFPSIVLGCSSVVQLYDKVLPERMGLLLDQSCIGHLQSSMEEKWAEADKLDETWQLLDNTILNSSSLNHGENSLIPPFVSQSAGLEVEGKLDAESNIDLGVYRVKATVEESHIDEGHKLLTAATSVDWIFDRPVKCVSGISSRHCRQLEQNGLHTIRKLLRHFPRTYADLHNARGTVEDGQYLIFVGKVLSSRGIKAGASLSFVEVVVGCEITNGEESLETFEIKGDDHVGQKNRTLHFHLKKFFRGVRFTNQAFLKSIQSHHQVGDLVSVCGKVKAMTKKDHFDMREYNIDILEEEAFTQCDIHGEVPPYPLYPYKGGLKPNFLRDIISRALQALPLDIDPIPNNICEEFGLVNLHDAYVGIHRPKDLKEAELARRRLIFDDFFYLQLGRLFQMLERLGTRAEKDCLLDKYRNHEPTVLSIEECSNLTKKLLKALPYSLTPSQLNAVSEIIQDMRRPVPMNRLLQGDVGCGKTVVAFLACMEVIGSGYQAAFMVPTELLATQHYEHIVSLLGNVGEEQSKPSVALLTGSTPSKQSRIIRKDLLSGEIALVIGTHSLIAETVEFLNLRLAVIDEQHRFGVIQRGRFNSKLYSVSESSRTIATNLDGSCLDKAYMAPHVLAMTATPIPRTLALVLYGDMSLSQITDLPPGRVPVETHVFEGNTVGFENMFQMMQKELLAGGKVYLVYPVIEESEQLPLLRAAKDDVVVISNKFKGYQCGLLHGRMKSNEKEEALSRFKSGETRILLSTQVIEIGVDVPDATMMVVMNAERFGIAQLHQLRGRVGRGIMKSTCIFLPSSPASLDRLKVLENSSDGFYLANMDLLLRGPGNLLGKKQSGHLPEFPIARLEVDGNIVQQAHLAALKVLSYSQDLDSLPKLKAELSMRQPLCLLGD